MREAAAAGVTGAITIATTAGNALEGLEIAKAHDRVWCSAGVHPLYADQGPHDWALMRLVAAHEKCVAWGELGLDNHYKEPAKATQRAVLDEQLAFIGACARGEGIGAMGPARRIEKPVVVHCREAFDELIPVLKVSGLPAERFVFHCFTGTVADMRKVLDFGAWVSFTGVVTYRNAEEVRQAARLVPADRIMVETDAPYLSPEPKRGERPCKPAMTRLTAEALAVLRGESFGVFHERINANSRAFFGIDAV